MQEQLIKRVLKKTITWAVITLLAIALLVTSAYFARITIANALINDYLFNAKVSNQSITSSSKQKRDAFLKSIQLTCFDFSINSTLNIVVNKLCLTTPKVDIEVNDLTLTWQLLEQNITSVHFNKVRIDKISIQATDNIFPSISKQELNKQKQPFSLHTISENITSYINQYVENISSSTALTLATPIIVKQFTYHPFGSHLYSGSLSVMPLAPLTKSSVKKQKIAFSINKSPQEKLFSVELVLTKKTTTNTANITENITENIAADLTVNLINLREFLAIHKITLPTKFDKRLSVNGDFSSRFTWHEQAQGTYTLVAQSQLNDFSINYTLHDSIFSQTNKTNAANKAKESINTHGTLRWATQLSDQTLQLSFDNNSHITTSWPNSDPAVLLTQFGFQHITPSIEQLLIANPISRLTLKPQGAVTLDPNNMTLVIAAIDIETGSNQENTNKKPESKSKQKSQRLTLTDIHLAQINSKAAIKFNKATFSLNSQLKLPITNSRFHKLLTQPIAISLQGTIENTVSTKVLTKKTLPKNANAWQLTLAPSSKITTSEVNIPLPINSAIETLNIAHLTTQLQGSITLDKQGKMQPNIQLTSYFHQLHLPKRVKLKNLLLQAEVITGVSDTFIAGTFISSNEIKLASFKVNDLLSIKKIAQPHITVSADNIELTDLLALNIKLPVPIKLIDGTLSYHFEGSLPLATQSSGSSPETKTAKATKPLTLSVSVNNVTGDINGTWLQGINWQQNLQLTNNQVFTPSNGQNLLTIDLIETASPITQFSANTEFNYQQQAFTFTSDNIHAKIFDGSFDIAHAHWPFKAKRSVNVQLNNIDLEKVLELDQKQGITVTGKISGKLPITFDGKHFTINKGELHNVSNGIIQVLNNPVVEELKANNTELKLAFDALQNLQYHQLSSMVNMTDDGYMLLETVIKGRNPDLDNDVNLNLNINYDLLGLLESISITERFENSIIKNMQSDALQKN